MYMYVGLAVTDKLGWNIVLYRVHLRFQAGSLVLQEAIATKFLYVEVLRPGGGFYTILLENSSWT